MTATADTTLDRIGRWMAAKLRRETSGYEPYTPSDPDTLRAVLRPGDILLVEGHQYISMVIEYLTMSSWSHAAIFVGDIPGHAEPDGEPHVLVEVNLGEGCVSAPLSRYTTFNTRVCRPVMLSYSDQLRIVRFMVERIGLRYDMRNLLDLIRYFFPVPLPRIWRRRAIAFGSGDPTRAICSSLIAEAFQAVGYPILPRVVPSVGDEARTRRMRREQYYIRHHSLFAPRDFDLSPYFSIVKPTIERGFDYKSIRWVNENEPADLPAPVTPSPVGAPGDAAPAT
jgi:hypothetical protein